MFSPCDTAVVPQHLVEAKLLTSDPGRIGLLRLAIVKLPLQFYCNLNVEALASGAWKSELRTRDATTGRCMGVCTHDAARE